MSEHFPDGTLKLLGSILGPLEDFMGGGSPEGPARPRCVTDAEFVIGQILADQAVFKKTTTSPEMSIGILQAYLKAVAVFPVAAGKTVADLLKEQDHKLWFALKTAGVG